MDSWLHDCGRFPGTEDAPCPWPWPHPSFHSFSFAVSLAGALLATVSTADGSKSLLHVPNLGPQLVSTPGCRETLISYRPVSPAASTFLALSEVTRKPLTWQKHTDWKPENELHPSLSWPRQAWPCCPGGDLLGSDGLLSNSLGPHLWMLTPRPTTLWSIISSPWQPPALQCVQGGAQVAGKTWAPRPLSAQKPRDELGSFQRGLDRPQQGRLEVRTGPKRLPFNLACLVQLRSLEFVKVNKPYPLDKLHNAA